MEGVINGGAYFRNFTVFVSFFSFLWKGHFFTNSHNSVLIHVRYVVLLFWQKERKNPLTLTPLVMDTSPWH